jgi:16S rRNA (guanine527-N7)-methyltransferase
VTRLPQVLFGTPLPGLNRPLTYREGDQVVKYLEILIKWQKTHRLVGSVRPEWLLDNVILDSLAFLEHLPQPVQSLADIGSGAGIPGIPIAIVRPDVLVTLIESRRRRVSFLASVTRELHLGQVDVVEARVEDLGVTHADRYDCAIMRCVAAQPTILGAALAIIRAGGSLITTAKRGESDRSGTLVATRTLTGSARYFRKVVKD